jgi:hypothetical protein
MDYRLDMFNSVKEYLSNIDENDAILVLMHNKKDGDCFTALGGDWEILSSLFSAEGYVNYDKGNNTQYESIRKAILNTAYNICMTDDNIKKMFIDGLK